MKTRVRVMGQEMILFDSREDTSERARIGDDAPHSHYAATRDDIRRELSAFNAICGRIGERKRWKVLELFGGSGWHSMLIQRHVKPASHVVWDQSADCVASVQASLPQIAMQAVVCDSLAAIHLVNWDQADWIHADFNLMTPDILGDTPNEVIGALEASFGVARELVTVTNTWPYEAKTLAFQQGRIHRFSAMLEDISGREFICVSTHSWGPAAIHVLHRREHLVYEEPAEVKLL